jgi:hypothetical protein
MMVTLLGGRLYSRVTAFETSLNDSTGGNFVIRIDNGNYNLVAHSNEILQTLVANGRITVADQLAHRLDNEGGILQATSNIVNRGYEMSTWLNLNRNITAGFNYSYTRTDRSNVFGEFDPWFAREKAYWTQTPGAGSLASPSSGATIDQKIAEIQQLAGDLRDFYNFGYGESPHRANVTGRYTFTERRLKGVFIGGGMRWQDRAKLGRNSTRTIWGPEDFKVDAFIGYRGPLPLRNRKAELTAQVNVTNLTDEPSLVPLRYNALQTGYTRVLLNEPRAFRFTLRIGF